MIDAPHDLRDYAMGELDAAQTAELERWLEARPEARAEVERLQSTFRALRSLPAEEPPRRIAFVSDKVFEPSPWRQFLAWFESDAPRLGFSLAAVLAVVFAGLWATEPTLRQTPGGFELAFGGAPAAPIDPPAPAPAGAGLTAEEVRAVVLEALAERPALDREQAVKLVEARVTAAEKRLGGEINAVRTDAEAGYFRLTNDLEALQTGLATFDVASAR